MAGEHFRHGSLGHSQGCEHVGSALHSEGSARAQACDRAGEEHLEKVMKPSSGGQQDGALFPWH